MKYDLEKRTTDFSKEVIYFSVRIKPNYKNQNILSQLLRAATSVGANYREANGSISKKEFNHKIGLCKKEINETKYWLELMRVTNPEKEKIIDKLWNEAQELFLIFSKINKTLSQKGSL